MLRRNRPGVESGTGGFTLIELMIAVTIVGILAAIALPSYRGYAVRANRADATSQLLIATGLLERWYATHDSYAGFSLSGASAQSPSSGTAVYSLTLPTPASSTFTVRAVPVAGSLNAADGFLEITHQGDKRWDRNNSGTIEADEHTWKKP